MSDAIAINGSTGLNKKSRKDVIVSIRLPKSLLDELKDLQNVNHFMDLSDEIRFIVRKYCLRFLGSGSSQTPAPIDVIAEQKRKEKLISELNRIIDDLKNGKNIDDDAKGENKIESSSKDSNNGKQ